jgi:hypothetical protein
LCSCVCMRTRCRFCRSWNQRNRMRWSNGLASTFPWHHAVGFLSVGYVKDRIYATKVWDLRDLWLQNVETVGTITLEHVAADLGKTQLQARYPTCCQQGSRIVYWFLN